MSVDGRVEGVFEGCGLLALSFLVWCSGGFSGSGKFDPTSIFAAADEVRNLNTTLACN